MGIEQITSCKGGHINRQNNSQSLRQMLNSNSKSRLIHLVDFCSQSLYGSVFVEGF